MWREVVGAFPSAELRASADTGALFRIEETLGASFPGDLRSFLLESDGLSDEHGTDLVWSAERILSENLSFRANEQFRSLYRPFDSLVFFGDNGGGDQFAFVRLPERNEVFVWDHETDDRSLVAPNLLTYLRNALGSDGEDWYR
ncbi:SMI1/KNR4 family protein [Streptomyces sp. D2-8]|uniref:SMI1/KNR4 family protein n=1 Tax=Streptomyces sp. D2-8 TaxID=2707767 RepID=UPI0020BFB691|nr:SMI1/KNR4 family protein [Streptomyces sp. D2-8]MCK8435887.1 SMI1/KNR4 family protein [Streptomyces sp. D2-8]